MRVVVLVHDRVTLASGDEPAVDGHGDHEGEGQCDGEAAQKMPLATPASMAPGISSMIALSTISMTVMDRVSAASVTGIAALRATPARSTGPMVSA